MFQEISCGMQKRSNLNVYSNISEESSAEKLVKVYQITLCPSTV